MTIGMLNQSSSTGFSKTAIYLMAAIVITGLPLCVQAQEEDAGLTLEEVIVTVQKREQTLQEAAVSITALTAQDISDAGIKDPIELQPKLPGVAFQVANTPVMVIRGVGTYNNQPGVDAAVAYVVDGTYLSHHPALPPILFDIRNIEVVRGPQGTLYGRNANGGAMNINTNEPVLGEFLAYAALTLGNYDSYGTEVMLNAPLGETAALRAAFATDNRDPYFDDGHQGADNYAGRLRLLFEPSEKFDFLATVDFAEKKHQGQGSAYCPPQSDYPACDTVDWNPYEGHGGDLDRAHFKINSFGVYAEMNWYTGAGTVTSITNYREYDLKNLWIWDFFDYQPDNDNKFFTQEIRLASDENSNFDWVIGGFYSREKFSAREYYAIFGAPLFSFAWDDSKSTSAAIFGQFTYPISDVLGVTAGLRYTDEEKKQSGSATTWGADGLPFEVATGGEPSSENRLTWKLGLEYGVSADSLLYANISTGFKSGGVNQVPPGLGLTEAYNPEDIIAYQAGSKNRFMDNRLQINGEVFYYDYEGYQQYAQEFDPTGVFGAPFFITVDSQKATFYGGEVEASILVGNAGVVDLYLTLLHTTFDEFVVGSIDNTGNDIQGAPGFTVGASYQNIFELPNSAQIRAQILSTYVDGHYTANNNAGGSYQESYTRTGFNITYISPNGAWEVTGFARNLEDEAVIASYADPISRGGDIAFLQAPRTYGFTVRWLMN